MIMKVYAIVLFKFYFSIKDLKNEHKRSDLSFFLDQDIHLSDFPEKHPKIADLFFQNEIRGGTWTWTWARAWPRPFYALYMRYGGYRLFVFQKTFLIRPRYTKD